MNCKQRRTVYALGSCVMLALYYSGANFYLKSFSSTWYNHWTNFGKAVTAMYNKGTQATIDVKDHIMEIQEENQTYIYKDKNGSNYKVKLAEPLMTELQFRKPQSREFKPMGPHQFNLTQPMDLQLMGPQSQVTRLRSVDCGRPWITVRVGGRLGNQICVYAHLFLLHLDYGIQVRIR